MPLKVESIDIFVFVIAFGLILDSQQGTYRVPRPCFFVPKLHIEWQAVTEMPLWSRYLQANQDKQTTP